MLLVQQSRDEPSSSSVDKSGSFWNGIWAAKVQPKIKLFIWRACKDILPTLANLFRRGVSHSYSCRWCEDELESSFHILWQCEFAQRVWSASSVSFPVECLRSFSFSEVISCSLRSLSTPSLEIMFTTAWGLWQAWNSFFWEEKMSSVEDICQKSAGIAMDFLEAGLDVQKEGGIIEIVGASRWRPPEEGIFKVNIACKFCSNLSKVGVGVLVRDSSCLVTVACTFTLKITGDILQSVAMAVVESMRFAIDIGLLRVEL